MKRTSHRRDHAMREGSTPRIHSKLDLATEYLLYAVLIFSPWAFGTTEVWAINTVNSLNYLLGGLLIAKWIVRGVLRLRPARWDIESSQGLNHRWVIWPLAGLTVLMLSFCAISAWNSRADFIPVQGGFEYFNEYRKWLPHSYDRSASWEAFRLYLAAACFFWALRDWLITKSPSETRSWDDISSGRRRDEAQTVVEMPTRRVPSRLKRLLWVLCANAALLAFEGTFQRLSGTNELLWIVQPRYNDTARAQFGPFNYRSNGAQYLNMIWPLAIAFAGLAHQRSQRKIGQGAEILLWLFSGMMIAAPMIATSRGGVGILIAQLLGAMCLFAIQFRKSMWKAATVLVLLIIIVASSAALQWKVLRYRFNENNLNTLGGRVEIYENAKKIVDDFPLWGSGPGTFPAMYYLYRQHPNQLWFAQAHDDFLQTRITFGVIGFIILLTMLASVFCYPIIGKGMQVPAYFPVLIGIGCAGCLLHARFDFPLQIYSLLLVFLTLCAILTCVSGEKRI